MVSHKYSLLEEIIFEALSGTKCAYLSQRKFKFGFTRALTYLRRTSTEPLKSTIIRQTERLFFFFFWFPTSILYWRKFCSRYCQTLNVGTSPNKKFKLGFTRVLTYLRRTNTKPLKLINIRQTERFFSFVFHKYPLLEKIFFQSLSDTNVDTFPNKNSNLDSLSCET